MLLLLSLYVQCRIRFPVISLSWCGLCPFSSYELGSRFYSREIA